MNRRIKVSLDKEKAKRIKKDTEDNFNKGIKIVMEYKTKNDFKRKERVKKLNIDNQNHTLKNVLIAILLILLFFAIYIFLEYAPIWGFNIFSNINNKTVILENISSNNTIYKEYNNDLLISYDNVIETYNKNGKLTWRYTLEDKFIPEIYTNGSYMVIANKVSGSIYVFSRKVRNS